MENLPAAACKDVWVVPHFVSPQCQPRSIMADEVACALKFEVLAECSTTKARASILTLPHSAVETPVFMPVGTQGTMKGLTPKQLEELDCRLILGNTYHLGMRPVGL